MFNLPNFYKKKHYSKYNYWITCEENKKRAIIKIIISYENLKRYYEDFFFAALISFITHFSTATSFLKTNYNHNYIRLEIIKIRRKNDSFPDFDCGPQTNFQ